MLLVKLRNLADALFASLAPFEQKGTSWFACEKFVVSIDEALRAGVAPDPQLLLPASVQEAHLAAVKTCALAFKLTADSERFRETVVQSMIERIISHLRGDVEKRFQEFVPDELSKAPPKTPIIESTWTKLDYAAALTLLEEGPSDAVARFIHRRGFFTHTGFRAVSLKVRPGSIQNLQAACQVLFERELHLGEMLVTASDVETFCRSSLLAIQGPLEETLPQGHHRAKFYGRGAQLIAVVARHLAAERKEVLAAERAARKRAWARLGREVWQIPALPVIPELVAILQRLERLSAALLQLNLRLGTSWTLDSVTERTDSIGDIEALLAEVSNTKILDALAQLGLGNTEDATTRSGPAFVERLRTPTSVLVEVPTARMPGPIRGLEFGNEVSRMLSSEALLLTDSDEQDDDLSYLFYAKVLERRLLSYQFDGRRMVEAVVDQEQDAPLRTRGPLIIIGDESGSMSSIIRFAKAMILGLAMIAHQEKRECKLIFFSSSPTPRQMSLDFSQMGLKKLREFLQQSLVGGTEIRPPLEEALRMSEVEFSVPPAVVIVTDGEFFPIDPELQQKVRAAKQRGVTFTAVHLPFTAVHLPDDQYRFRRQTLAFCDKIHTLDGQIKVRV